MMEQSGPTISFPDLARQLSPDLRRYLERYVGDRTAADALPARDPDPHGPGLAGFAGRSSAKTWAFSHRHSCRSGLPPKTGAKHPDRRGRRTTQRQDTDPTIDERLVVDEMKRSRTTSGR